MENQRKLNETERLSYDNVKDSIALLSAKVKEQTFDLKRLALDVLNITAILYPDNKIVIKGSVPEVEQLFYQNSLHHIKQLFTFSLSFK